MRQYTDEELDDLRDEFPRERNRDCNGRYCGERDCPTCSPPEPDEEEPLSVDQVHSLLLIGVEPEEKK